MNALVLSLAFLLHPGGEYELGLEHFAAGRFAEAADAFAKALAADPDNGEVAWNLALARWRAGDRDGAESAADQAAVLSDGELSALRDGLVGNLRHEEAMELAERDLAQAVERAKRARDSQLRAAQASAGQNPEILRNLERSTRLLKELEKKKEEQEQESENDPDGEDQEDQDQKKDQEQQDENQESKDGDQKQDQKQEQDQDHKNEGQKDQDQKNQGENGEPKPDERGSEPNEPKPEPSKDEQPEPPEDQEQQSEQAQSGQPQEPQEPKELSPQQVAEILEALDKLEQMKQKIRAQQQARRPKVKKDW